MEWELLLDLFCKKDLSHDINDRRYSSQSRTCHDKIFPGKHTVKDILGCFFMRHFKDVLPRWGAYNALKWGPVEMSQIEISEISSYIWKSHLCL